MSNLILREYTDKWTHKRLIQIRKENQGTRSPNAIEILFQQIANINEMSYVGNSRREEVGVRFQDGSMKFPDFRFKDQDDKVVEVVGTHSHRPAEKYAEELIEKYSEVGVTCFVAIETEIVNNPQEMYYRIQNFYGKCPNCGQPLQSLGTEPPYCSRCDNI